MAVKTRWGLRVNQAEKTRLTALAAHCPNDVLTIRQARVVKAASTATPTPTRPAPSGLDPRFGTCSDAHAAGYGPYYRDRDPEYTWYRDGDSDGVVCE